MLNYGAAAQNYFNHNKENLANEGYGLEPTAAVSGEISGDQEYLIYLREMWKRREESSMDDGPGGQGPCSGGSLPGYRP